MFGLAWVTRIPRRPVNVMLLSMTETKMLQRILLLLIGRSPLGVRPSILRFCWLTLNHKHRDAVDVKIEESKA